MSDIDLDPMLVERVRRRLAAQAENAALLETTEAEREFRRQREFRRLEAAHEERSADIRRLRRQGVDPRDYADELDAPPPAYPGTGGIVTRQ